MSKILTAKELIKKEQDEEQSSNIDIEYLMIEFAKIHVEVALKEASIKAKLKTINVPYEGVRAGGFYVEKVIDNDSIIQAYSLKEIK